MILISANCLQQVVEGCQASLFSALKICGLQMLPGIFSAFLTNKPKL